MAENIALVVLDTLRQDSVSDSFDFLSGVSFTNAYATSHWTIPVHASILTGKYPSEVGVHAKSPTFDCPDTSIVERLENNGYQTRMWSANANLTAWNGWNRGFEQFIDPARLEPGNENLVDWASFAREHDNSTLTRLIYAFIHSLKSNEPTRKVLKQGYQYWRQSRADGGTESISRRLERTNIGDSEFLVVNLMETHTPYHAPGGNAAVEVSIGDAFAGNVDDPEYIQSAYETSVECLSKRYKFLFELLENKFDYVITVGDHGEMLGEDGMWNHGYGLYPELVHVPLVISGDGIDDTEHEGIVSLLDLHKTIADIANIDVESRGQNLLQSPGERPLLTEYHGFRPSHREQFERKGAPEGTYDNHDSELHGVVLPDGYGYETHSGEMRVEGDLTESRAKSELEDLKNTLDVREVEEYTSDIDEETKQQLRELGYA
jgi:arylsulfatase